MTRRLIVLSIALAFLCFGQRLLTAGEQKEQKKDEAGRKGKTVGLLTEKGPTFIEVKADGEEKGRRYVPQWVGGNPDKGGGPDKAIVKLFSELKVGSRVEVEWVFEERLRALKVKVLSAPKGGEKKDTKGDATTGRTIGVLVAKGDKFIEVRGDGEEKARKYHAHYLKGPPPGFDAKILAQFDKLHLESRLLLEWISTNHGPQVTRLEVLKGAKGAKKDEKTSRVVGILTGNGKNFIELKADGDEEARKYFLHFGGTPKLLKAMHDTPIGSRVQVEWLFFEHRRVIDMEIVRAADKK